VNPELPAPVAYGVIGWNGAADGFVNTDPSGSSALSADLAASSGSSLVGFIQSGTGAVARTVQDKGRDTVSAFDFMTAAEKADVVAGTLTVDVTTAVQAAIDSLQSGQQLEIDGANCAITGLTITDKSNIGITGKGGLKLVGAASNAMIFKLSGTCDNIDIHGLRLSGEGNAAYSQHAVGNLSGQTLSNIRVFSNKITDVNVGVSLNANLSGSYDAGFVMFNTIKDVSGIGPGQGYGVHLAKATNSTVFGNVIDNASRHSIYHAAGYDVNNKILGNTIKNHRSAVATGSLLPAINIGRCSGVLVAHNIIDSCYDGGLYVFHDTSTSSNTYDIEVSHNTFRNRKNVIGHLYVGEAAVPTSYLTKHVTIKDNKFHTDAAVAGGNDVRIYNGQFVTLGENAFRKENCTGTQIFVTWGDSATISATSDFTGCEAEGNSFIAEGSSLVSTQAIAIASDVSTGTSSHRIDNRRHVGIATPTAHASIPTNPNLMVITESRCYVSGAGAGIAAGTTAGMVKTTAAIRIVYRRSTTSKAITDNLWDLTGVSTGVGEFRKVLLCIDTGATARILAGDAAASQAAAQLPRLPDYDWCAVGVVEIPASYAGGTLAAAAMYDFVGIYEQ
jgi:hypothetical protein